MAAMRGLILISLLSLFPIVVADLTHRRYEYRYCFKDPYLAQHDGSIPFWDHSGSAQAGEDRIRLTSSLRSQKGQAWTRLQTTFEWWEVEITFSVEGNGRVGADGLAFWFTEQKGVSGPVFGSNDKWKGLALIFDSFDNDNKGNNPYISAVLNDGTKVYDHEKDGSEQQLAGCQRDFRNKKFPTKAKIEYYNNVLTVHFHNGLEKEDHYEMCLRAENVYLPKSGHFGLSAATGGLADNHDVMKFLTYSLKSSTQAGTAPTIPESEKEKFSREYDQFSNKLEQKKEEYKKQHPDKVKQPVDQKYETAEERELRQIYDGQNAIFRLTRELNHKCDEIIGRQERTLSLVQTVQATGGGGGGQPPNVQVTGGAVNRHEIETMLSNQREMVALARDIKGFVADVHQKVAQGMGAQQVKQTGGGGAFDNQMLAHEIRDGVNELRRDVSTLSAKSSQGAARCPTLQGVNCVSTGYFLVFIILQCIILIGYIMYKNNKDAQAKKFY